MISGNVTLTAASLLLCLSLNLMAKSNSVSLSVEEQRLAQIKKTKPHFVTSEIEQAFLTQWQQTRTFYQAKALLHATGTDIWHAIKRGVQTASRADDRPLYWQRLAISAHVKRNPLIFTETELLVLLEEFELSSRGYQDINYVTNSHKNIFITGFDPFLLDKNIEQSNPSGLAALALDGKVISYQGEQAEINAVIVPVRYEDFDQGEIETLLAPIYLSSQVDLVATISMGRTDFDLERFPGKRRSVTAPDNLNMLSGGSKKVPVISSLAGQRLSGPEFVEFSLPVAAMKLARGKYQVNDNRRIETLDKGEFAAHSLAELGNQIAVSGSGGGYLSNEISYRSIRLKNLLGVDVPTGHIHTPRINEFEHETNKAIVDQIEQILMLAITDL